MEVVFVPNPNDGAAVPVAVDPNAGAVSMCNVFKFRSNLFFKTLHSLVSVRFFR